jgi:hypothetical protein
MPKKVEDVETIEEVVESTSNFDVAEPQIVRPQDLPLVVTPKKGGSWANEAQAEFARTVNAYAYKNPKKWDKKKGELLAQLERLATNPDLINVIRGAEDENTRLTYSNKLMES